MSTWTQDQPPTHLTWTNMDIWLTTYPPLLVHVVIECPLTLQYQINVGYEINVALGILVKINKRRV